MLSSRDTPMNEDGWSLIIEDLRRLALLVGGGSNDLNAGAIDADQQAINDLSTALNSHEVDPAAHADLLANYQLRADAFTPTVTLINAASGTLAPTGVNYLAQTFTAPAAGVYHVCFNFSISETASVAGKASHYAQITDAVSAYVVQTTYRVILGDVVVNYYQLNLAASLTSGQVVSLYCSVGDPGGAFAGTGSYSVVGGFALRLS